ncbi:MAG: DNA/RNA non-specific endonuclease [Archangiaceae bacterium]|nr:DNA/RNA non-specific endonuclease [Archangiaceae bacterium]
MHVDDEPRATTVAQAPVDQPAEEVDAAKFDAGAEVDAGVVEVDAGVGASGVDAGGVTSEFDAGIVAVPFDAGVAIPNVDAGVVVVPFDAGVVIPNVDAGVVVAPLDAGAVIPNVDAGVVVAPFDAGAVIPNVDAGVVVVPFDAGVVISNVDAGVVAIDAGVGTAGVALSTHTVLGLPDDSSVGRLDRWLLVKPQYVSSYDTTLKTPRWVSWRLDPTWLGSATRATSFRRDTQLPTTAGQARDEDFRNSGFDRGHLCPSADRTSTDLDNDATFVFTNIVPQTHASNAGTWATLEDEARTLVAQGKTVVITAGPIFGVTPQNIGAGVPVPLSTFKVAVVFDGAPTANLTTSTRVIAVIVPNTTTVSGNWRQFRVTARSIEQATGLDFLSDVPRAVQDVVENRLDVDPP